MGVSYAPERQGGQPGIPFQTHQFAWPLDLGQQMPKWQAGGPSGFADGTAGAIHPWPYITGFKMFIAGFPFGDANTAVGSRINPNLGSGNNKFLPIGYFKQPTYTDRSY